MVGATLGKTAYLRIEAATNQNIAGIISKDNNYILDKFVFYTMISLYPEFQKLGKYKMVSQGFIREMSIWVPELNEQKIIVEQIEKLEKEIIQQEQSIANTEEEKKAILTKYLEK